MNGITLSKEQLIVANNELQKSLEALVKQYKKSNENQQKLIEKYEKINVLQSAYIKYLEEQNVNPKEVDLVDATKTYTKDEVVKLLKEQRNNCYLNVLSKASIVVNLHHKTADMIGDAAIDTELIIRS